jgi:hypothetical protein
MQRQVVIESLKVGYEVRTGRPCRSFEIGSRRSGVPVRREIRETSPSSMPPSASPASSEAGRAVGWGKIVSANF